MASRRSNYGPTPNGGVRSVIMFQDANGRPADEKEAVQAEILEYDKNGDVVMRTYARINGDGTEPNTRKGG